MITLNKKELNYIERMLVDKHKKLEFSKSLLYVKDNSEKVWQNEIELIEDIILKISTIKEKL